MSTRSSCGRGVVPNCVELVRSELTGLPPSFARPPTSTMAPAQLPLDIWHLIKCFVPVTDLIAHTALFNTSAHIRNEVRSRHLAAMNTSPFQLDS